MVGSKKAQIFMMVWLYKSCIHEVQHYKDDKDLEGKGRWGI